MIKTKTHYETIWNHLKKHGRITTSKAEKLGVSRGSIGAVVAQIRKKQDVDIKCLAKRRRSTFGFTPSERTYKLMEE